MSTLITTILTMLDEACAHCPECGWSDFIELAPSGRCPCCGTPVIPAAEVIEIVNTIPQCKPTE